MGRIIGPEPGLTWQEKVEREASLIGQAYFQNFKHCMDQCIKLVPDQLDPKQRIEVLHHVAMAAIGGVVVPLATFGNHTPDFEEIVVAEIRDRFKYIRDNEARIQNERIAEISEAKKKGKLIT